MPFPRPSARFSALVVVGLALFTDTLLYALLPPILPRYAEAFGLSQLELGGLFGSYAAALLVSTFPLGTLVDRVGRRGPFLWGLLGLAATTLLFAFSQTYVLLVGARILQGVAAAATWVAGMALLADHFPPDQRGRAMSTVFASANVGLLLGPYLSGWMVKAWGPPAPFLAATALVGVDALARILLLPGDIPVRGEPTGYLGLLRNRTVRVFSGVMALGASLGAVLEAILPLHMDRRLGMDSVAIGSAFTLSAVASTLVSPLVGRWVDARGPLPPLRLGLTLTLLLLPLVAVLPSRGILYGLMFILGGACSLLMSPCGPALASTGERLGGSNFGAMFSLLNIAFALGMMAGPILGSALAQAFGLTAALTVLALVFGTYHLLLRTEVLPDAPRPVDLAP